MVNRLSLRTKREAPAPLPTGRHSQIEALLRKQAESEPTPPN